MMLSYLFYILIGLVWGWRSGTLTITAFVKVLLVADGIVMLLTALSAITPPGLPPFSIIGLILVIAATLISLSFGYFIGTFAKQNRIKNDADIDG